MNPSLRKWLNISLFNLLLVAFVGVIMRYKIAFSLPFVDQKFLLHGHSHFAFAGWVTQALMSLLVGHLTQHGDPSAFRRFRPALYANLLTAYGMLITFPFQGYAFFSIVFSTASIFTSYWFAIKYWRALDRSQAKNTSRQWFKAALFFNALSSFGAFSLAFMLATRHIHPNSYLASVYFFLHFQYNGWFFFAGMGLLTQRLFELGTADMKLKRVYLLFVTACVPAYFLSALWLPLPRWAYLLVVVAVFFQLAGWVLVLGLVKKALPLIKSQIGLLPRRLFFLCGIALTIKLSLQAGSVIPSLSKLAFGFRPIVIGYLHLVLLGVVTLFILSYFLASAQNTISVTARRGIILFTAAIIFNELLLMVQGIADLYYVSIPYINESLLVAAFILFGGIFTINYGQWRLIEKEAGLKSIG